MPFSIALPTWLPAGWKVYAVLLTLPPTQPTGGASPLGQTSVMLSARPVGSHHTFVDITELKGHGHIRSKTVHEDGYTLQDSPPAPPNMWAGVLINGLPNGVSALLAGPKNSFARLNHIAVDL